MMVHTMRIAFLAAAIMAAALPFSSASSHRSLLQNVACQPLATQLISECNQFLGLIQGQAGNLASATDEQIQQAVGSNTPSPACCATVQRVLSQGCRCDPTVSSIAASVGIQPSGFYTLSRAGVLACRLPPTTDVSPPQCPGGSTAGK